MSRSVNIALAWGLPMLATVMASYFFYTISDLRRQLKEKEAQVHELYYRTGCGRLPNTKCETTWRHIDDDYATDMHGIAPVSCAERDAVVWVDPYGHYDEDDGGWTFRCVPSGSQP